MRMRGERRSPGPQGCSDSRTHGPGPGTVAAHGRAVPGAALSAAVGLRNRIAHEYGGLELGKVYVAARDDLGDLDAYADVVGRIRLES